jgi:hypothetical protein
LTLTCASGGGSGSLQPPLSVGVDGVADGSGVAPGSGVGLGLGLGTPRTGVGVGPGFGAVLAEGVPGSGVGWGVVGFASEPHAQAATQHATSAAAPARSLSVAATR